MGRLELDKWDLKRMHDLEKKGRLDLRPEYQRGKVWEDYRRYGLVDTVMREWPMGLILLKAYPKEDEERNEIVYFDVVDGQQRLTTLFDYIDGKLPILTKYNFEVTLGKSIKYRRYHSLSSFRMGATVKGSGMAETVTRPDQP